MSEPQTQTPPSPNRAYLFRSLAISAVINQLINAATFLLTFGANTAVSIAPNPAVWRDLAVSTFMMAFMPTLIPGLLTRTALRRGTLKPQTRWHSNLLPQQPLPLALAVAILTSGTTVGLCALLRPPARSLSWDSLLALHCLIALLTAALSGLAILQLSAAPKAPR